ncbi:hypothetical protein Prudu_009129 [Prunus dulcis]|uniref:SWIM-type domain-containing protein n=1 Tax=Prunus dulcis TaxID=3755 RepID=A0A4Y1R620_PRUDU|nr:hypothetical protein Prudu_009129 [Prunus dulcis]
MEYQDSKGHANYHNARDDQVLVDEKDPVEEGQDEHWPHQICKNIFDHVQQKKLEACNCTVQWSGGPKYQVDAGRGDQYVVDLDNHTCSCRKWDLLGIPCAHGIAAIHYKKGKAMEDYDEAKATARVRRKLAYARAKAVAATAKKVALNASQPNAAETAGIGLRASKRQRTEALSS